MTRRDFETAEQGASSDVTKLVDAVPGLMREAARRRNADRSIGSLAAWALPRLAAATAAAVLVATWVVADRNRQVAPAAPPTFESVFLGSESGDTGDVVFDALLAKGRRDG